MGVRRALHHRRHLALPWLRGYKWSKVDITTRPRVLEWCTESVPGPPSQRGLAYGVPEDEIDSWSKDRRANYAKSGASIADNASIAGRDALGGLIRRN